MVHSFVGASHFTEVRENRPVTVREILINLLKWVTILCNAEEIRKLIRTPYLGLDQDHQQKLEDSAQWHAQS